MDNNNLTLTMLGTGHATVTKCYSTCFLLHDNEDYFMVDAGGGNRILGILEGIHFIVLQDGDTHKILNREITFFDIKAEKLLQFGFRIETEGFIFCGDEPLKEELYKYAERARWMLHEAFCLKEESEKFKPHEKKHSTVKDACVLAEKLKVQNLVLVHTEDSHVCGDYPYNRKGLYIEEGKQFFSGNLYVPDDKEKIKIGIRI